jgi:uncharacterized protein YfaS (alpha-2-macroglobulin family)
MARIKIIFFLIFFLLIGSASAFDLQKAKSDYRGADFRVASVKEGLYENAPAIIFSFTAPLSKGLLRNHHITIFGGGSEHWIISKDQTKVIFPFVSPETRYTVVVSSEIRDINGQTLNRRYRRNVKTKRLNPTVNFTSSGHILSSSSPKRLTVTTLNINKVNIDFFLIDRKKIPSFIPRMRKNGSKYYYNLNQIKKYGKLVYSGRFELKPRKNQRTDYNINLAEIRQLRGPGLYVAVMGKPGSYEYKHEYAYFMQTNIGLHLRRYRNSFDVYAQDITTGKPIKSVKIVVVDKKGDVQSRKRTDINGNIRFFKQKRQSFLIATKGDQLSVLELNRNALDLSGLKNPVTSHSEFQIYPFGPRDLYRPSEKVKIKILVRDYDGKLPPSMPLSYTLYKPNGGKITSDQLQPTEKGFYSFEYQTNDSSQTGKYRISFTFGKKNTSSHYFKLEDFLPERLDLKLFDGKHDAKRVVGWTSSIEVPVASNYHYGSPAAGNKVDGFVFAKVDPHPFKKLPNFYFGDSTENIRYKKQNFRNIKLSKDGTGKLSMNNRWFDIKSPVRLNISASVYETGGRPVTRSSSLTILNNKHFIGIEPQFSKKPDSNSTVKVKIGCVDKNGRWVRNKRLQVALIRMDRNWYWKSTSSRGWHWAWNETPTVVFSKSVFVAKNAIVNLPLGWGSYRVEVSDNNTKTSYNFKTSWSWWGNSNDSDMQKPDQISLGFGKTSYKPGDTVKLRINPPQSGLALITIESSDGVLFTKYMQVKSEGTIVAIKTERYWNRHDLYASVMVIKPGNFKKTPVPTRSFGMVHIPLKRENTKFDVEITSPDKVEPNRMVTAKIKVKSNYPLPKNTKVVVSLVDVGILNITRYKTPNAESYFLGPRRYNVDLYDNYGQIIDNIGPKNARHMFGGGFKESEGELARGGDKPKSDVTMVSFISKPLDVDSNGEVTASFDLPNFNGKLRWMVMVYADEQFGQTDSETKVADKIVTQISMPRFLAMGDKSTIALDLHNMSGTSQTLSYELKIGGSLFKKTQKDDLFLKDQEKATLIFPIRAVANSTGKIKLHVESENQEIRINRTWMIGVRSPYPATTRKSFAVIEPGSSWRPNLKTDDLSPGTVRFQMTLSNKPPIDYASHFEYLLHYPYGCLEQSTSSGYPWVIATPEVIDSMGLNRLVRKKFKQDYSESFRAKQISNAVALVLNRLKSNGSFGLWSSSSPEHKWLTVYASEFLNDAKRKGAQVSRSSLRTINWRLRKYLQGNYSRNFAWSNDNNHYEFAFRSYAGYVLAKENMANLSQLRRLSSKYKNRTDDDGLSWMYMAAAFKLAGDYRNADICYKRALKEKTRVRYRYYGEYGSKVRDLARITELALANNFENANSLLIELADAVKERKWLSTQERIALFKAAIIIENRSRENWRATLIMKDREQNVSKTKSFNTLFDLNTFRNLTRIRAKSDTLYATISLVGTPKDAPKPQSNEISIKRTFFDMQGNVIKPNRMKSGELAVVRLEVTAKKRTPDGLVVDLLPAGVEIENQNLGLSSIKLDDIRIDGKTIGQLKTSRYIKHEEFRDDRYVAAIDINRYRGATLFYLIRAVTPGEYKVPGSYVEDMYRPYRFGIGATFETMHIFK